MRSYNSKEAVKRRSPPTEVRGNYIYSVNNCKANYTHASGITTA